MAPEVVKQKVAVTAKADIWSLGGVVVQMATGMAPWQDRSFESLGALLTQIARDDPRNSPLTSIRVSHDVHPDVEHVLTSCFRRNADERPLARDLLRLRCFRDIDPLRRPNGLRSLKDAMSSAAGRGGDPDGHHRRGASADAGAVERGTRVADAAPLAAVRSATPRAARREGSPRGPASRVPYLAAPARGAKGAGKSVQFTLCILRGNDASASHKIMGASVRGVKLGDPERPALGAEANPFSLNGSYGAKAREQRSRDAAASSQRAPWSPASPVEAHPATPAQQRSQQQQQKRANPFALGGAKSSTPPRRTPSEGVMLTSLQRRHGEHGVLNPVVEWPSGERGGAMLASHDSLGLFPAQRPAAHPL
jgi:hypothetical protein